MNDNPTPTDDRQTTGAASSRGDGYAQVNGVRLHYVEQGAGSLILFLHGFPEFWYAWKDLLPAFARDRRAVALDMRGYNLSGMPKPVEAYREPVIVEDIRLLTIALGAEKFVLVGHDWGGVIAWDFAAAHPEMLEKLVIVNAPHRAMLARQLVRNPAQQKASAYFNLFATPEAEAVLSQNDYARLQQAVFGTWTTDDDRQRYLECWRRGLTGGLNYYRAAGLKSPLGAQELARSRSAVPSPRIAVPTLVIWGEKDFALLPGLLDGLDERVSNLKIVRVPEAGHWVVHEQPQLVIQAIRAFLGET
ncbi:MAG TPA: alpha/beta hydrolase [Candidatus Acidoferrales bacterium]|nr:alpha/beta hydrolase [Candidatus Acidoferrales bacterium]